MQLNRLVSAALATIAVASPVSAISWPSEIRGHGNLTVNMTAIANGANVTLLHELIADSQVPETFNMATNATIGCDNPVNFTSVDAVSGLLCLDTDANYTDYAATFIPRIVNVMTEDNSTYIVASKDDCSKSCYCKCEMGCIASLFLYPLCWAGCTACPN